MTLIEDDDVIQTFPADRADQAFREGILPGGARGDEDFADAHGRDAASEGITIDRVPIAEQIFGRRVVGEGVDHLAGRPRGGRVIGDIDMDESPAVVTKNDEAEEQTEGQRGDDEEIDGGDLFQVGLQEAAPSGRGAW